MKKDILIIFSIVLIAALLIMGTDFQSVEEFYQSHPDAISPDSKTVYFSIRCETVLKNTDKLDPALKNSEFIPSDGLILPPSQYVLNDGDSVFDLLSRIARYHKIQLEFQGADLNAFGTVFVEGINHLYEFSCGSGSGWTFLVNGENPQTGCSKYKPEDGDFIEWFYTCNYGEDYFPLQNAESDTANNFTEAS